MAGLSPLNMPIFALDDGMGVLLEDYRFITPIQGVVAVGKTSVLNLNGVLVCRKGMRWDFGSGPAIDTPDMVSASLAHDALYNLMSEGELPRKYRKAADKYFLHMLERAGMGWARRHWCYLAVRYGWPVFNVLGRIFGNGRG